MIIYSSKFKREERLQIYESAIEEWQHSKRVEFNDLNITVTRSNDFSNQFDEWNNTDHVRVLEHDYYGTLPTYDPMMYHLFQPSAEFGFVEIHDKFNTSKTLDFNLSVSKNDISNTIEFSKPSHINPYSQRPSLQNGS
jgi:hypothetical protein